MTRTTAFLLLATLIIVSGLAGVAAPRTAGPAIPASGHSDAQASRPHAGSMSGNLDRLSGASLAPAPSLPAVAVLPASSDVSVLASPTGERQGIWAYADASHGPRYLAIPEGRNWQVRVCGPAACLDRLSTDAGPELWLQKPPHDRIGDLSAAMFEEVCGVPISLGLCPGSYTILGRVSENPVQGARVTLPPTDR